MRVVKRPICLKRSLPSSSSSSKQIYVKLPPALLSVIERAKKPTGPAPFIFNKRTLSFERGPHVPQLFNRIKHLFEFDPHFGKSRGEFRFDKKHDTVYLTEKKAKEIGMDKIDYAITTGIFSIYMFGIYKLFMSYY